MHGPSFSSNTFCPQSVRSGFFFRTQIGHLSEQHLYDGLEPLDLDQTEQTSCVLFFGQNLALFAERRSLKDLVVFVHRTVQILERTVI